MIQNNLRVVDAIARRLNFKKSKGNGVVTKKIILSKGIY